MKDVSLKDLLEAGCHFGHRVDRWHPKAAPFIYQERNGIHVIDLAKTRAGLIKAADYIKQIAATGGVVIFVGTKRQAVAIIKEEAAMAGALFMQKRWIGGFLTNWEQVHKNLEKIRRLTEEEKTNAWKKYPKHERVKLSRYLDKIEELYGGVVTLTEKPAALVIVDVKREMVAVREAQRSGIPLVGIVDTNSDPTGIDYVVPANDDAVGSIKFIVHFLAEAYLEGIQMKQKADEKTTKVAQETAEKARKAETEVKTKPVAAVKPTVEPKPVVTKPIAEKSAVKAKEEEPKKKEKAKKEKTEEKSKPSTLLSS